MLKENPMQEIGGNTTFDPEIISVWLVERNNAALKFTQSLRGQFEPENMYCAFISLAGTGKLVTETNVYYLRENTFFIAKVDNIITYNGCETEPWKYFCFNYVSETRIPFFQYETVYNVPYTNLEKETIEGLFSTNLDDKYLYRSFIKSQLILFITKWALVLRENNLPQTPYYKIIRDCANYIQANLDENISVKELAKKYNMSESSLYRAFIKNIGMSPKNYILEKKINLAKYLLKTTSDTIENISFKLGYYSPFQFSRDFKKKIGISPKHFRNNSDNS